MTNQQAPEALRPIARYKIGYHTDEWGVRSSTPGGITDPSGQWALYKDHIAALASAPAQAAPDAVAPPSAITASIMRDDGGEQSAFCLMVAYRSEKDARAALAMIAAPPDGMVAGGYLDHLRLMMEHSAFAGALQLDDALENIDEFACAFLSANAVAETPAHIKAMERAWLWMENQADSQSKGGHATFDLMMLREERDALRAAIDVARAGLEKKA